MVGKDYFIMQIRYKLEVASGISAGKKVYKFLTKSNEDRPLFWFI